MKRRQTVPRHAGSYYQASARPAPARPALHGTTRCDICVIGAGFTGISAALELVQRGYSVVILEGNHVGWGASGRNGGQLINGYSRSLDVIGCRYGVAAEQALGAMALEGGQIIRERVARHGINCALVDGNFIGAINARHLRILEHEAGVWARHDHEISVIARDEVAAIVQTDQYVGGIVDPAGGHFHPLDFLRGEAVAFEQMGGTIHEDSRVLRIEDGNRPAACTAGGRVEAEKLLVCGNAYLGEAVPELTARIMPVSSQIIATEPLGSLAETLLPANYCIEDANFILNYYRRSADGRMLFGGGAVYGGSDPASIIGKLRPALIKTFPALKAACVDYAWSGNFALTLTRVPQIGRTSSNIYFSHGDSGHGVTTTQLLGRLLAEGVAGQLERFDAFANLPYLNFPGGRTFRVPITVLGSWFYALRDRLGV